MSRNNAINSNFNQLTAGTGINLSNTAGNVTISSTASELAWTDVTGTTQLMVAGNGYVADNAGLVTLTLPATAAFGTLLAVQWGVAAGGWTIAQNAGQNIQIGSDSTAVGVGGSLTSTAAGDGLTLLCITADTTWAVQGPVGNITVV